MTGIDKRLIEHTVRIGAPPETVWRYWVDPVRVASWWGVATRLEAEPGGAYRVEMETGSVMVGEFLELVPYERIVFGFGWDGVAPGEPLAPGSTQVEVTLAPDGTGTRLTVRHHDMPAARWFDHATGWDHFLAVLADRAVTAA